MAAVPDSTIRAVILEITAEKRAAERAKRALAAADAADASARAAAATHQPATNGATNMADRNATYAFGCVLDGASVGTIAVTGAKRSGRVDCHLDAERTELKRKHFPGAAGLTVSPGDPVAGALWASVAESVREFVRDDEPELAADLDASAGIERKPDDNAAGRATAHAAGRARRPIAADDDDADRTS